MFEIRKIQKHEVQEALDLALETFMEFETPDYSPEGVASFKRDITENREYIAKCEKGICPIYAAFDGGKIIGIIGMRENKTHINLVFTKKEYHRRGIATAIFRYLLNDLLNENPDLGEITLNSAPYGLPFYQYLGFVAQSEEQVRNGIRYTPMKYSL